MPERRHQLRSITLGDAPSAWAELGFEVRSTQARCAEDEVRYVALGNTAVLLGAHEPGCSGWSIDGGTPHIEGLAASEPSAPVVAGSIHPNGIESIDHVVVTTGDVDRTAAELAAAGIEQRGERSTDSYGSPMRQQFYWLGDVILELVGPGRDEPTSDEPPKLFGLALVAPDLDATTERLGDLGGTPKNAVQPGRRIAGIRGERTGVSIPLAVMSPHRG